MSSSSLRLDVISQTVAEVSLSHLHLTMSHVYCKSFFQHCWDSSSDFIPLGLKSPQHPSCLLRCGLTAPTTQVPLFVIFNIFLPCLLSICFFFHTLVSTLLSLCSIRVQLFYCRKSILLPTLVCNCYTSNYIMKWREKQDVGDGFTVSVTMLRAKRKIKLMTAVLRSVWGSGWQKEIKKHYFRKCEILEQTCQNESKM